MIYMDVTSASASPINMGVQRTVRGLHRLLASGMGAAVTPVRWDFFRRNYALLSKRERDFLENPFASYQSGQAVPGRWQWKSWLASCWDSATRGARLIDLSSVMGKNDVLFIPDLCWDLRIYSWKRLASWPGRKVAVFHDAMPLNIPGQAESNDTVFRHYVAALGRLDQVICISKEVRDDLLRYWAEMGVEAKPTPLLVWPVPFSGPRPDNRPNQTARHLIYVARLKLRKNHLVLLEACESLWSRGIEFSLDLIGVEDSVTDTWRICQRVDELAAKGRPVRWRKHISDEELNQAYQAASFTVFPSRMEGFGLPILESLWHGRPVICGRNGAIGEVASDGGGCLQIDQNDPSQLAAAMEKLLSDPDFYQSLCAEAGRRHFRTWEEYGRDLGPVLGLQPAG
ncbi:MAG: glycosyltransferase family 1 protein [Candidatus Methylacidiphilales bacterium]|nr:glycosyltransferase family 1 protein [Candidatus Methylacidiphilales bacterium]